jgi:transcriptional regulator with XRE-family HTH domain
MLESAQIRAARALLGWHQEQLAKRAKIGLATLQRLERAPPGPVMAHVATVVKITRCLEKAGIAFIMSDAVGGIGVRFGRRSESVRR